MRMRILRRVCRRTEASFMRRQPCRAAVAAPRQIGKAALRHGKTGKPKVESRKSKVEGRERRALSRPQWPGRSRALPSKNFPTRRRRFPNLVRRGEVARSGCGRMMLASMRRHPGRWLAQRDGAPVSQLRRGSALCASVSLCEASLSFGSLSVAP